MPQKRHGLKLILWAGDGEHEGVSDVKRLRDYDVFVCYGFEGPFLNNNINDLSGSQTICRMDVHNADHMAAFRQIFHGAFTMIDADYYGNTPVLPLSEYVPLLSPSGRAYHTEGINSLVMPQENILNVLEIFAPVLNAYASEQRRWSQGILELAKRDDIPASHVWSSPDLRHSWYDHTRDMQDKFVHWQKMRNPAWPACAATLEEHCDTLSIKTLCVRITQTSIAGDLEHIRPYLQEFHDYLLKKIDTLYATQEKYSMRSTGAMTDYLMECIKSKNIYEAILIRQNVLKWLSTPVPDGLVCMIGYYEDERYADYPQVFGAYYVKDA